MIKKKPIQVKSREKIEKDFVLDSRTRSIEIVKTITDSINKKYGKTVITPMSQARGAMLHKFSTGSVSIDLALSGGWVCGKPTTLWGKRSSGKTALATVSGISHINKNGLYPEYEDDRDKIARVCVVLDLEDTYDPVWAQIQGADPDLFILAKAKTGEQCFDVLCDLVDNPNLSIHIIVDSVKAIISTADMEMSEGDKTQPATHARIISRGLRKLMPRLAADLSSDKPRHNVLFLNQVTQKIGIMFGDPETFSGGMAYEHYQAQILKMIRTGTIKVKKSDKMSENLGFEAKAVVQKDKTGGQEGASASFTFYRKSCRELGIPAGGIDNATDIIAPAINAGILDKKGNSIAFDGEYLSRNGVASAALVLRQNHDIYDKIHSELFAAMRKEREQMIQDRKDWNAGNLIGEKKPKAASKTEEISLESLGIFIGKTEDDEDDEEEILG